ncbi:MAG TPA: D-aminoacylase [Vicinamibacterales bacterium]|nr:D-aminoacylase [Vicinamibacterales bacterium]
MTLFGRLLAILLLFVQTTPATRGILVQHAQLIDGTGAPARRADVRVAGDTISAVAARLDPRPGERVVDATGLVLAPGFIDMHSHADRGLDDMPDAATQVRQGITTAVVGQDGSSELPVADFYAHVAQLHPAINYATSVGHGTVRSRVMGDDFKRSATADEIDRMKALVDQGMRDGAIGLSSGLEYDPGFYSKTDELVALGSVVARHHGIYSSHVRNENEGAFDSWREAIEIGRRNGIPVEISHIKLGVKPVWGRAAEGIGIIDAAKRDGVRVMADWYPYTYWQSSMYVLIETRDFANRAAWEKGLKDIGGAANVLITNYRPDPSLNGKTLADIAAARGADAVTTAIDMMKTAGPNTGVIATSMSEDDLKTFVKSPDVLICSDGSLTGRHPRGYNTFPRVLARYVRDLQLITLPDAIAKMTGRSAAQLGFADRGIVSPGRKADLVIFDAAAIQDHGTPADASAAPTGISYVIVNGEVVLDRGTITSARPGRGLKRAS